MTTNNPEEAMTDRELLEMAAKAAGINIFDWTPGGHPTNDGSYDGIWNPLTHDGDALRLAVKLDIHFKSVSASLFSSAGYAVNEIRMDYIHEPHGNDPCAATRRAIVRAAAETGRTMP